MVIVGGKSRAMERASTLLPVPRRPQITNPLMLGFIAVIIIASLISPWSTIKSIGNGLVDSGKRLLIFDLRSMVFSCSRCSFRLGSMRLPNVVENRADFSFLLTSCCVESGPEHIRSVPSRQLFPSSYSLRLQRRGGIIGRIMKARIQEEHNEIVNVPITMNACIIWSDNEFKSNGNGK